MDMAKRRILGTVVGRIMYLQSHSTSFIKKGTVETCSRGGGVGVAVSVSVSIRESGKRQCIGSDSVV